MSSDAFWSSKMVRLLDSSDSLVVVMSWSVDENTDDDMMSAVAGVNHVVVVMDERGKMKWMKQEEVHYIYSALTGFTVLK